ncbi:MAG TPA: tetratricopeptide repeat protein, partial [Bacteroidia bacterium]|nr:tetratricopeptide repeat protein [Bacteroidia bacterium]
ISWQMIKNSQYDSALLYAGKALQLTDTIQVGTMHGWAKGKALAYNHMGVVYRNKGNYAKALNTHFSALKIREELNDKKGMCMSYNNIGNIYYNEGNYQVALKNYLAAVNITKQYTHDTLSPNYANTLSNIGGIYLTGAQYANALKNYQTALSIFETIKYNQGMGMLHNNIGELYEKQANYTDALKNYYASADMFDASGYKQGTAAAYNNIGEILIRMHNLQEAYQWLNKGLNLSVLTGVKEQIKFSYINLAKADSAAGNYKSALENYKKYIIYKDSLNNEENTKKTVQAQMQYEFDKKETIIKQEQEKKDAIAFAEGKKQKIILYSVSGFGVLVLALAILIFRSLRINQKKNRIIRLQKEAVERQKHLVEEKQKEVIDSITYAKRIQRALITSERYIEKSINKLKQV